MKQKFNKSKDRVTNDKTYRRMKNRLEKEFPDKYVVIADGKFVGATDSPDVTRAAEKPRRTRILGSSLVAIGVDSSGDDAHHECDNRSADYEHN